MSPTFEVGRRRCGVRKQTGNGKMTAPKGNPEKPGFPQCGHRCAGGLRRIKVETRVRRAAAIAAGTQVDKLPKCRGHDGDVLTPTVGIEFK